MTREGGYRRRRFLQFGAGNIGRSLCGQIFSAAGYEVVFVDAAAEIVAALNRARRYRIVVKDDLPPGAASEIWVENVRGIHAADREAVAEAVAEADLISTAVGAGALMHVFPLLAAGLARRQTPVSIIFCENLHDCVSLARRALRAALPPDFDFDRRVGLVATSIGKMVPIMPAEVKARDPLEVWAEAYNLIIADREGFVDDPPPVPGLVLKRCFIAYVERKLYVHNYGHAVAAYLGHLAGKRFIWECMADPSLRAETEAAMRESAAALTRRYPDELDAIGQEEHVQDLLRRFHNRALGDTVFRVGRDLRRKLAPGDRCVGTLRLLQAEGMPTARVCNIIAAALRFCAVDENGRRLAEDEEVLEMVARQGPEAALVSLCGFTPADDREIIADISSRYAALGDA